MPDFTIAPLTANCPRQMTSGRLHEPHRLATDKISRCASATSLRSGGSYSRNSFTTANEGNSPPLASCTTTVITDALPK